MATVVAPGSISPAQKATSHLALKLIASAAILLAAAAFVFKYVFRYYLH